MNQIVEIRHSGFCWKAVRRHLGGNGTSYYRFNGRWEQVVAPPPGAYRAIRKELTADLKKGPQR